MTTFLSSTLLLATATVFLVSFVFAEQIFKLSNDDLDGNAKLMFDKILHNEGESSPMFALFMSNWPAYKRSYNLIYDTLEEEEQRFVNFAVHYCAMSLFQVQLQFHPNLLPFKPALTQYAVMTQEETRRTLFKNMGDEEISRKWVEKYRPTSKLQIQEY